MPTSGDAPRWAVQAATRIWESLLRRGGWQAWSTTMNDVVPHIRVVAAVIEQQGRYLINQRRSTAVLAGLWEFPSGRVEPGETDEAALQRELQERVGVDIDVGGSTAHRTHRYDGYVVDLVLYRATIAPNQRPRPVGVADLRWVAPQELENFAFPPADQATADLLFGMKRDASLSKPPQTKSVRAQVQKPAVN